MGIMSNKKLDEKVIEREGIFKEPVGEGSSIFPWLYKKDKTNLKTAEEEVAIAARGMGYKEGDVVKYRIIVEPKK